MNNKTKIYLVSECSGLYEEYQEVIICGFFSLEKAEKFKLKKEQEPLIKPELYDEYNNYIDSENLDEFTDISNIFTEEVINKIDDYDRRRYYNPTYRIDEVDVF